MTRVGFRGLKERGPKGELQGEDLKGGHLKRGLRGYYI